MSHPQAATSSFNWPENAKACVSLSYDDGTPDNLDHALPDLAAAGFLGTFYLYKEGPVENRMDQWRAAFHAGHEIGSHTVSHPCRSDAKPRKKPLDNALENYTPAAIQREIHDAAAWLDQTIGHDPWRTFAYPCGATAIGLPADQDAYVNAVASRHRAARTGKPQVVDPMHFTPHLLPAFMFKENTLEQFQNACQQAIDAGGWSILVFHSIDGPNHNTTRQTHQQLLAWLKDAPVWVTPVNKAFAYLQYQRGITSPA